MKILKNCVLVKINVYMASMHRVQLSGFQVGWSVTMADDKTVGTDAITLFGQ